MGMVLLCAPSLQGLANHHGVTIQAHRLKVMQLMRCPQALSSRCNMEAAEDEEKDKVVRL